MNGRLASPIALALVLALGGYVRADEALPAGGAWSIQALSGNTVQFETSVHTAHNNSEDSHPVPLSAFHGLSLDKLNSAGGDVTFTVVLDAGSFNCRGSVAHGHGGGDFTYEANPHFADELAQRGVAAPTALEQFQLTVLGTSLAYIDELRGAGYQFSASDLVRLYQHGVTENYVKTMLAQGYHPASITDFVALVDHGVTASFAAGMAQMGYKASAADLIRLADHGVTLAYVSRLRAHGYHPTIDELIRLRDSGV